MASRYFAHESGDTLVGSIQSRREAAANVALNYFPRQVQTLARRVWFDVGNTPAEFLSTEVTRGGEQGSQLRHRVNDAHQLGTALVQVIGSSAVALSATADNLDVHSSKQAVLGTQILESLWKHRDLELLCRQGLTRSTYDGEAFLLGTWDASQGAESELGEEFPQRAGDLRLELVPSDRVIRPVADSYAQCAWVDVMVPRNRYDLIAEYPEATQDILAAPPLDRVSEQLSHRDTELFQQDEDIVALHIFLHRKTPAVPDGRCVYYLDGAKLPLKDETIRTTEFPLIELMPWLEKDGTAYGYSQWWLVMATQEVADWVGSALATNTVTYGHGIVVRQKDDNMPVSQIGNGPLVMEVTDIERQMPKALNLSAPSPEAFKLLEMLAQKMRSLIGLNDVAVGQSPSAEQNATALTLLYSAAVQQQAEPQKRWVAFIRRVGELCLQLYQVYATTEQKIRIVGDAQKHLLQNYVSFRGEDIKDVSGVTVEIANPTSQTAAGNLALADELAAKGWIQTPEQYVHVRDTGKLLPLENAARLEYELLQWENEELRNGSEIAVAGNDNHALHYREHGALLKEPAVRSDPALTQGVLHHMQEHVQVLQTLPPLEAALSGNMLPQVAPPGGPPGAGAPPPTPMEEAATPTEVANPATGEVIPTQGPPLTQPPSV